MLNTQTHGGEKFIPSAKVRQIFGGISDMSLWRWRKERGFPSPLRIGGRCYFDIQEVLNWADSNRQQG